MDGLLPISPRDLFSRLGTASAPRVFDVRRTAAFEADEQMLVSAQRRTPDSVAEWVGRSRRIGKSSFTAFMVMRSARRSRRRFAKPGSRPAILRAASAAGPSSACRFAGKERLSRANGSRASGPKIDRIACPWLIRRFINPDAAFLFVPTEQVFAVAAETGAAAYDIPGAEPFSHHAELCSFDAFLKVYGIKAPGARCARVDRARGGYQPARIDAAIAGAARALARTVGQLPGRPRDARTRDHHVRRPLCLMPIAAGRNP